MTIFTHLKTCGYVIGFNTGDLTEGPSNYPEKTTASGHPLSGLSYSSSIEQSMYDSYLVPEGWYPDTDVRVGVHFFNDVSQSGIVSCRWGLEYQSYNVMDNVADKRFTKIYSDHQLPQDITNDTFFTAYMTMRHADIENPIHRNQFVSFRIFRDCSHSSDTMVGDAILALLTFEFTMEVG